MTRRPVLRGLVAVVWAVVCMGCVCRAAYLPGVTPVNFRIGDQVNLFSNNIVSARTLLPFSYADVPGTCHYDGEKGVPMNLGRAMGGDAVHTTNLTMIMMKNMHPGCRFWCIQTLSHQQIVRLHHLISREYEVDWIVDNLPAIHLESEITDEGYRFDRFVPRFALGSPYVPQDVDDGLAEVSGMYKLHNHFNITIKYHTDALRYKGKRVISFEVEPQSIDHSTKFLADIGKNAHVMPATCYKVKSRSPLVLNLTADHQTVVYTYSVQWKKTDVPWEKRWDILFTEVDWEMHWLSFFTGTLFTAVVAVLIGGILLRTCGQRRHMNVEDELEQSGWKMLHGDVFRSPPQPLLFSVVTGSGLTVMSVVGLVTLFSALGLLAPPNRGGLLTAIVVLYVLLSPAAGYYTARLYKMFNGQNFRSLILLSSLGAPGIFALLYFITLCVHWSSGSSAGLGVGNCFGLVLFWMFYVGFNFIGLYFGFKHERLETPTTVNQIPRYIPKQPVYNNRLITFALSGVLPFGLFYLELFFLLDDVWHYKYIASFSFLFMSIVYTTAVAASMSVMSVFFRLRCEDYQWWWTSFLCSASASAYIYVYHIYFMIVYMQFVGGSAVIIYMTYALITSLAFFLYFGVVGFLSTFLFIRQMYSSVNVD